MFCRSAGLASAAELTPPKAGKPEILPLKDVKPGMHAIAWTVFSGMTPEPVPVEIIGVWKNAMGPRQHVIMGKMGGKAERTGVAGGMSGSPVYVDGKADRRRGAAPQPVFARRDLRHHAHRIDARNSGSGQVAPERRAHSGQIARGTTGSGLTKCPANWCRNWWRPAARLRCLRARP